MQPGRHDPNHSFLRGQSSLQIIHTIGAQHDFAPMAKCQAVSDDDVRSSSSPAHLSASVLVRLRPGTLNSAHGADQITPPWTR